MAVGAVHAHVLGPDDTARAVHGSVAYVVATGWGYGVRTVLAVPTVAATLSGLAAHRDGVRHQHAAGAGHRAAHRLRDVAGLGTAVLFSPPTGMGSFLANFSPRRRSAAGVGTPPPTARSALAAVFQLAGAGLHLPVMMACGFLLGAAGQVVKLCADSAMQLDVDDALRGHVFTVQDSLFWVAVRRRDHGGGGRHSRRRPLRPHWSSPGAAVYIVGLAAHAAIGRRAEPGTELR